MSKKNWKTAQELMAELEQKPEFLRRRAEKERRKREREERFAILEHPILAKLRQQGFEVISIVDLVHKYSPLPPEVVADLLDALTNSTDLMLSETLIRALAAAAMPFDGRPLVNCYEASNNDNLRW